MQADVILGLQWGDEGKGKIVDALAPDYDIICRFQGGPNAGHTLYIQGQKVVLHTVPSGIFHPNQINLIGNGVVIDPVTLIAEFELLEGLGVDFYDRLLISEKAHLILPTHLLLDKASEQAKGQTKIGSTLRGIGPTYMDKTGRNGLRMGDILRGDFDERYRTLREKHQWLLRMYPEAEPLDIEEDENRWFESIERLRRFRLVSGEYFVNRALDRGQKVLAEGAQGMMLDVDFGTYPYVTSSNTITAGVCTGLGVPPNRIGRVLGISKAYCTRVGQGPFPTELIDETGEKLRAAGNEFGATTGRPRRCGWIDIPQLNYAIMINGVTDICLTKIDVLSAFDEIGIGTGYDLNGNVLSELPFTYDAPGLKGVYEMVAGWRTDITQSRSADTLPDAVLNYIRVLGDKLLCPISMISTGPERDAMVFMNASAAVTEMP